MKKEDPRDETEIREIDASPLSKELKSAGPTSSEKFMKQTRFSVPREMPIISFIEWPDVIKMRLLEKRIQLLA